MHRSAHPVATRRPHCPVRERRAAVRGRSLDVASSNTFARALCSMFIRDMAFKHFGVRRRRGEVRRTRPPDSVCRLQDACFTAAPGALQPGLYTPPASVQSGYSLHFSSRGPHAIALPALLGAATFLSAASPRPTVPRPLLCAATAAAKTCVRPSLELSRPTRPVDASFGGLAVGLPCNRQPWSAALDGLTLAKTSRKLLRFIE